MDIDKAFGKLYEEVEKEARTYKDRTDDDEKKKKKHFAFGGKKKSRHGESGYGKGEEVDRKFVEAFGLDERKMTDAEMAEREEIVKKMKPKLQSFKDRYGDDAKSVMYATATKQAMEEVKIEEKKSATGYELYHKTFSDAMQHAYAHAKSKGFVVDPKEIDDKVATGPKKPSSGKTNRYSLKAGRKKVEIQVANLDNKRYELNMYIEGVDLGEGKSDKEHSALVATKAKLLMKQALKSGKKQSQDWWNKQAKLADLGESTKEYAKSLEKIARDRQISILSKSDKTTLLKIAALLDKEKKEEVELDEAFSMGKGDKRVVDAFYDQKEIKAHGASILTTDGKTLTKRGMGGQDIAKWVNGKIKIVAVSDVKSTELILKYMKKSIPSGVFEEMGNVAPTAPDSGGIQYQAPVLGQKKKKKKQTIGEEVQRTTFAGKDVFIVDSDTYYNCRLGKKKYGRYEKYVGDGEVGQTIREYGLKYPRRPIILQNGESGPMLYLKYGRS